MCASSQSLVYKPVHLWGQLRPVQHPLRLTFSFQTTMDYISDLIIIFTSSSLDTPSDRWVDSWAYVILSHCYHLTRHQHAGQCLAREWLLLVPGLRRQGAECAQPSGLHTKIIPGSQSCLGNMARSGDLGRNSIYNMAYQAMFLWLYISGSPVSSYQGVWCLCTPRKNMSDPWLTWAAYVKGGFVPESDNRLTIIR